MSDSIAHQSETSALESSTPNRTQPSTEPQNTSSTLNNPSPTRIFIRGCGAVSPAGWGVQPLIQALENRRQLPTQNIAAPGRQFSVRPVPPPNPRPACLAHPRLRRASAISQYATVAAVEALTQATAPQNFNPGPQGSSLAPGARGSSLARLGIVVGVHAASIRYSEKFFAEVLRDAATASPLLFPETVINAPASHLAANLASTHLTYSVLGDQTAFFQALLVAAGWLATNRADIVLAIAAEETAWTVSATANFFSKNVICSEGAGALCLMREPDEYAVELTAITDPAVFTTHDRVRAVANIAAQFLPGSPDQLLCDSRTGAARWDSAEARAWKNWQGTTLSPRESVGEGLSAATAWQFIAAVEHLRAKKSATAIINTAGSNQQVIAARLSCAAA
jgi:3-oxoacyl-(acyl-carrier-protein) synthase